MQRGITKDYLATQLLDKLKNNNNAWKDYLTTHKGFHKWLRSHLEEKLTNYLEEMSIGDLE